MPKSITKYKSYKDSEEGWIDDIPSHWKTCRLKYLLSEVNERSTTGEEELLSLSKYSGVIPKSSLEERAGQANSLVGYKKVYENHLVINKMQAVNGLLSVSKLKGITSPDYSIYKSQNTDCLNIYFLNYLLLQPEYLAEFKKRVTGVMEGFIRLYTDDLYDIKVIIPPVQEQTAITNFLDQKTAKIDQAIATKEKQITLLTEHKQILIQNTVIRGLNIDAPMQDSGVDWIGEIPEHWEVKRIKNIFQLIMEPSEKNNDHELLSIYTDIGVKPRKELKAKGNKASTTDGYWIVKKGDFIVNKLLAWMGAIGLSNYEGVTSPAYDILRSVKPIEGMFYHYLFRTKSCSAELKKHSRGIMDMRLRLYFDKFGVVMAPYPPKEEQTTIVEFINAESLKIDTAINLQQQQIDKLKEYKATLINSAVTGKIRVLGVEDISAEVKETECTP